MPKNVTFRLTCNKMCDKKRYMTLEEYINKHSSVTKFAAKLGKSRQQIYRYMHGKNLSKRVIDEIHIATGGKVKPTAFFKEPKNEVA